MAKGTTRKKSKAPPEVSVEHDVDSGFWTQFNQTPGKARERVDLALKIRGRPGTWLHEALLARGMEGITSYSTVHRYLTGAVENPPMAFWEESAAVLGFRAGWFILGEGEPTEEGEQRRAAPRSQERDDAIDAAIAKGFPYLNDLRGLGRTAVREAHVELVRRAELHLRASGTGYDPARLRVQIAEELGRALSEPLGMTHRAGGGRERLSDRQIHDYTVLMVQAVLATLPAEP
ncbi:MAG TPA: hypothetical protein VF613_08895 [Longimicrobium sp.]